MTGLEIMGAVAVVAGAFGLGLACWEQRREIERLRINGGIDGLMLIERAHFKRALEAIAAATADIKHGTARKVHRMATEALK